MKKSIIKISFLLFSFCAMSQTILQQQAITAAIALPPPTVSTQEVNTTFGQQMATMFGTLESSRVPHGLLLDLAMEFTNVPAFNGILTDSTSVRPKTLKEIYNTLLMSRIRDVSTGFVTPDQFENNWFAQRAETYIALSGLYFKYSRFATNASTSGKLTYTNGKIYDTYIGGVWQNPYQEMQTFAITTPIEIYTGLSLKVKIPQAIFYSNYASEIQSIAIDFEDGLGFRQVAFDQLVDVNYSIEAIHTWKYKLTLTNGQIMLSQSKIKIKKGLRINNVTTGTGQSFRTANTITWNNCSPTTTDLYSLDIQSTAIFAGLPGKARVFIDDAGNDCKITKPLIVVEGFDLTTIISPETRFSSDDYVNFTKSVFFSGSSGLKNQISGSSASTYGDQQYDIIYVNWDNGMDYIERNALVVEEVIKWVNAQKAIAGSTQKNVLMGQSMGGIVCRNALLNMEQKSPPYIHQVRLFVSQDSPQQGATLPLSIQYLFHNVKNQVVQTPAYWLFNAVSQTSQFLAFAGVPINPINNPLPIFGSLLDRPATAEMLINRTNGSYILDNTIHDNFYTTLNARGFPVQNGIRNIAISNGNECGKTQNFNQGDAIISYSGTKNLSFLQNIITPFAAAIGGVLIDTDLFTVSALSLFPGGSHFDAFLEDRALYQNGGNKIHDLNVSYTKWILGIWKQKVYIIDKQLYQPPSINKHFDNYGGGFIDIGSYSGTLNVAGLYVRDKFCLVPTPSALSINATTDANYKIPYIGALPPTAPLNTPFANFTTAFKSATNPNNNNEKHLEFNSRNGNWLAAELNNAPENNNCSFLCNTQTILGLNVICNTASYIAPIGGTFYDWQIVSGNNLATLTSSNSQTTTLIPIIGASGQITIRVSISGISSTVSNYRQSCGYLDKTIWVGVPSSFTHSFNGPCLEPTYHVKQNNSSQNLIRWKVTYDNTTYFDSNSVLDIDSTIFGLSYGETKVVTYQAENSCGFSTARNLNVRIPTFAQCVGYPMRQANPVVDSSYYTIYPNPTNTIVNIDLKNQDQKPNPNANIIAELYNMMGEVKRNVSITNNIATIDVSGLPKGIYLLKINIDGVIESHQVGVE